MISTEPRTRTSVPCSPRNSTPTAAPNTTLTSRTRPFDGAIHNDSETKRVTALIYLNTEWDNAGGRLRLLYGPNDIDDMILEELRRDPLVDHVVLGEQDAGSFVGARLGQRVAGDERPSGDRRRGGSARGTHRDRRSPTR